MQNSDSLKSKTVSGLIWSFADLMANQGIQFIIQVILARLLLPEHFGLIGMVLVFISISNIIIDSGFTAALVREQNPSKKDYSTVFYCNLFMGFLLYLVLYNSANFISTFFGEPELTVIIRVLALVVIINSLGIIQRVILTRNLDFKTQTIINIFSGVSSGVISIVLAVKGFGVWSLVFKNILMQLIQIILLWFYNKWMPSFAFDVQTFKRLFGFSSKTLTSSLIGTIYNNLYFIVIGKFFSASQLGYYTNAVRLRDVASMTVTSAVQRVTYPVLSKIQEDEIRLRNTFKKVIKMTAFVIFPFMTGLAAVAHPLIILVFGDKWLPSILFLQLLCLEGMLYPLHAINLNILQVKGRSDLYLLLEIIKRTVMTILVIFALWFETGIVGIIISSILYSFITLFANIYYSGREISYSMKEQLRDIIPILAASLLMGAVVYTFGVLLSVNNFLKIVLQMCGGISVYVIFCKILNIGEFNILKGNILARFKR